MAPVTSKNRGQGPARREMVFRRGGGPLAVCGARPTVIRQRPGL